MIAPKLVLDPGTRGFEGLEAIPFLVDGVRILSERRDLEVYKAEVAKDVQTNYSLDGLRGIPELRAYRDFFWRAGIDPTKVRPAAEALLRRILQGKPIPRINTLVDAYNLASIETRIALAAFDSATIHGDIVMRMAHPGETLQGIGMTAPVPLSGKEIVNEDARGLIAIYPHRDSARTAITMATTSVVFLSCGVPGISRDALLRAEAKTRELVLRFSGA